MSVPLVPVPPRDDETLERLVVELAEDWSHVSADESGEDLALRYARAAYGLGYVRALQDG